MLLGSIRPVSLERWPCGVAFLDGFDEATGSTAVRLLTLACSSFLLLASNVEAQVYGPSIPPVTPQPTQPAVPQTSAPTSPIVFSFALQELLTNNVNLTPSDARRGDLVTQLTPTVTLNEKSAHASLTGTIAAPILLYARTAAENNQAFAQANVTGTVEAIDKFFFVDGAVSVQQQYLTPLGAVPVDLSNATQNRYTSQSYSVSPYLKGVAQGGINYELRDNNIWSNLNGTPIGLSGAYTNELVGHMIRDPAPWGWSVDYDGTRVKFTDQGPQVTQLARLSALYQVEPQLQFSIDGGYEKNRYPLSNYQGAIYGVGGRWQPTDRTNITAGWEHRFFGSSYYFTFDHRTPLSVWSINASRNTTSYPQQLASLPAGSSVALLLNQLLSSSIPDPVQRLSYIDQLIQSGGFPTLTSAAVNLYTQEILLQETATGTVGLIGARNKIFLTGFYLRNQPISGSGTALPGLLLGNNTTQSGGDITWTHNLTSFTTLTASFNYLHTLNNAPPTGTTNQGWVRAQITTNISPDTSLYAGARYQVFRSDITAASDYNEAAVFVGLSYTYH
jgi:uncharacterized protein (PEP-CTERM system associated)